MIKCHLARRHSSEREQRNTSAPGVDWVELPRYLYRVRSLVYFGVQVDTPFLVSSCEGVIVATNSPPEREVKLNNCFIITEHKRHLFMVLPTNERQTERWEQRRQASWLCCVGKQGPRVWRQPRSRSRPALSIIIQLITLSQAMTAS